MASYQVDRSGVLPMRFDGELIRSVSGKYLGGMPHDWWHDLAIYRHRDGGWVVTVSFRSRIPGEADRSTASRVYCAEEIGRLLTCCGQIPGCCKVGSTERTLICDNFSDLACELFEGIDDQFS